MSDVRRLGLRIDNRQRHAMTLDGESYIISEYRFVPEVQEQERCRGDVGASPAAL